MNKFFIIIIVLLGCIYSQLNNLTPAEVSEAADKIKITVRGIEDGGWEWIKVNWYFFLLAIVGLGSLIVRITPTKKDDAWYERYILGLVRFIGRVLSLGAKKK